MKRLHATTPDIESGEHTEERTAEKEKQPFGGLRQNLFFVVFLSFFVIVIVALFRQKSETSSSAQQQHPALAEDWSVDLGPTVDRPCSFERLEQWTKDHGGWTKDIFIKEFPLENGGGFRRGRKFWPIRSKPKFLHVICARSSFKNSSFQRRSGCQNTS